MIDSYIEVKGLRLKVFVPENKILMEGCGQGGSSRGGAVQIFWENCPSLLN